ncbi:MAG: hypothetical protein IT471_11080 [Pseudomonadales bacterium]|nr:hypothetical protein [Pseudomonadales bacterium]MCC6530789.1 hypothetical protein [Pseudomonadales bacterium]MCP5333627.1 hypothetical protein [Pseudomonadales bacterium]HMU89287.1 hypothetical protein [Pseudomonadales bacterium]HMW14459.1 hypothetical protein [Pseudomonadales bacterium]
MQILRQLIDTAALLAAHEDWRGLAEVDARLRNELDRVVKEVVERANPVELQALSEVVAELNGAYSHWLARGRDLRDQVSYEVRHYRRQLDGVEFYQRNGLPREEP